MKDPLSKKWLMALLFSAIGLYLVVIDKLDAIQYMIALAANLGIYTTGNIAEGAFSKAVAVNAVSVTETTDPDNNVSTVKTTKTVTTDPNATIENPPSSGPSTGGEGE